MADYERTIIQFSLDDVIHILEHEPVQPDLVPEITITRIMNRGPVAHLSIERALKFLIERANGTWEKSHSLHIHLEELRKNVPDSAAFLDKVFDEAVNYYRIKPNSSGKGHFKNLSPNPTEASCGGTGRGPEWDGVGIVQTESGRTGPVAGLLPSE